MGEYDDVLSAIRRITRAIDLHSKRLVKSSGLTVPQLIVLQSIRRQGRVAIGQIASDVSLSQGTVTAILDRLSASGLVQRERSGDDKRVVLTSLTEAGLRKLEESPELMQAGFVREFEKLESWERHMLVASLERIAALLHADDLDASPILTVGDLRRPSSES
jgi:DNA-binding MarR family transcriptional regulator